MQYYNEIREKLLNNEITKRVKDYSKNKSDLDTYYNVGKLLNEAGKHYGEGIIKNYSKRLIKEVDKKYTKSSLYNMMNFYILSKSIKFQTLSGKLSYSHFIELLVVKDYNEIEYYIGISIEQNLSVRQLREKIRNREYQRLPEKTRLKLINNEKKRIEDFVKNPIIIKNTNNIEVIKEKTLQKLILEDIPSFLKELGSGFTFIENEYKIKIGNTYNYIDLLLFNYKYNCFVIIELKVTELKKEHIGQIHIYMSYIDNNLKSVDQEKTIGIIICKKENKYILEYCSDKRILSKEYKLV